MLWIFVFLIIFVALVYLRVSIDFTENCDIIIHYWWRGERREIVI